MPRNLAIGRVRGLRIAVCQLIYFTNPNSISRTIIDATIGVISQRYLISSPRHEA